MSFLVLGGNQHIKDCKNIQRKHFENVHIIFFSRVRFLKCISIILKPQEWDFATSHCIT